MSDFNILLNSILKVKHSPSADEDPEFMCSSKHSVPSQENVTDPGSVVSKALVAGIGGAVAAMGWLPSHSPVMLILGIAAILYLCRSTRRLKEVIFVGFFGSLVFFAIINRSLVSAYGWGGWTDQEGMAVGSSGWWLLNSLWILISVWGSLFWTVMFAMYWRLRAEQLWLRVAGVAVIWAGVAEWLRSISHWSFEWGFLGLAFADVSAIRQWSAVFGLLFLSSLIVGASALLVEIIAVEARHKLKLASIGIGITVMLWFGGVALNPSVDKNALVHKVAAFQFSPPVPAAGTTDLGMSPLWFPALAQIVARNYQLIVLPESLSSHAVEFDGVPAQKLGAGRQVLADKWEQALAPVLQKNPDTFIAIGTEGVERGKVYNSTSIWNQDGLAGWQHKVHLVPFAEYLPPGWGMLGNQALTYYQSGERYQPIAAGAFLIGSFICQEVQHADAARELVRQGANILITGGNDGVFTDYRVAQIHHSMARVRATEVGRYLVRAMKNGISSIISPSGQVVGRSPNHGSTLVAAAVSLQDNQTLWVRFGNWPMLLAVIGYLVVFLIKILQEIRCTPNTIPPGTGIKPS